MNNEEIEFDDGQNPVYQDKVLTFNEIVMEQFRKCCYEGSKEFTFGEYIKKGNVAIRLPNQAEVYCNCVKKLKLLLIPKLDKNKNPKIIEMKENLDLMEEEIENEAAQLGQELEKKYSKGETAIFNSKRNQFEIYILNKRVELHQGLFLLLNYHLKDKNYGTVKDIED